MAITKAEFSEYIKAFQFRQLFNEMGWNNDSTKQPIVLEDIQYNLYAIAEKSGFRIFICEPPSGKNIPDRATRKKIESKVTKLFQEHIIVFIDEHKREQVWQLAVRKAGSPTKISETRYTITQDPELLYQRASGLFFTLDEEEKVTIIDVTKRVADNFQQNNERVTKKFYESFKKEHTAFLKFIKGIDDQLNMDWYASLMLNRLMFCYFIQKKGFLDNNKNYLQDKLKACKEKKGKNKFYSFYREFLLALFHKGLGAPEHSKKLEVEIGKIPYLNGGLFDEHEIEKTYNKIAIDDKAFEKLFDFFDQYEWHLDTREAASGRDINPDVIGYIFEKYINDRAQMGAYYTKEDITDYIAKNCIIPWLFDEVKRHYPKAFSADGWLWKMVKTSEDAYIYDAVKYGVPENGGLFDDFPSEITKGFAPELEKKVVDGKGPWLWELRKEWNKPAPSDIALPTEIYREVIERRKRYADTKAKIESGDIKEINDFITYNLNIRQFAQDVIETTDDAEFIRHFYKALSSITILDPTCGSGAFLFAAMNILEQLYEACILRMKDFIDKAGNGKFKYFKEVLAQVNAPGHPNLQYFIYKSIILNNLYGVDIMNEAVEIAKLRLFLKLVATVDADYSKPNLGLEPLPDVDFNIRAGNTLVGYTTKKQIDEIAGLFVTDAHKKKILEQCDIVARAFVRYKEMQLSVGDDYAGFKNAKDYLNERLKKLTDDLDGICYMEQYGGYTLDGKDYRKWLTTHQPFHWFAEFYEIIVGRCGFDVIIGNPPYISKANVRKIYNLYNYITEDCSDIYANVIEQVTNILTVRSRSGLIVPMSITFSRDFTSLRSFLFNHYSFNWFSSFARIPAALFNADVRVRNTIHLGWVSCSERKQYSTVLHRWFEASRPYLFDNIRYASFNNITYKGLIPKIGLQVLSASFENCFARTKKTVSEFLSHSRTPHLLYYKKSAYNWLNFCYQMPPCFDERGSLIPHTQFGSIYFRDSETRDLAFLFLNGKIMYVFWAIIADDFHVAEWMFADFPIDFDSIELLQRKHLLKNAIELDKLMQANTSYKLNAGKKVGNYNLAKCRSITNHSDAIFANILGLTHIWQDIELMYSQIVKTDFIENFTSED